jgi:hypothetical protein
MLCRLRRGEGNIRPTLLRGGESECGRSERKRVLSVPAWAYVNGVSKPDGKVPRGRGDRESVVVCGACLKYVNRSMADDKACGGALSYAAIAAAGVHM